MTLRTFLLIFLALGVGTASDAQQPSTPPVELESLKASLGVWDAEIEYWPGGPDAPSIKFKGVETNQAYGEYWIASDLDSFFEGKTMKVHSIVGYDLDRGELVGLVVDDGPYSASLTGAYDAGSKTVSWKTEAKMPDGTPIVQQTEITQTGADERMLVMRIPGAAVGEFTVCMRIRYTRRK